MQRISGFCLQAPRCAVGLSLLDAVIGYSPCSRCRCRAHRHRHNTHGTSVVRCGETIRCLHYHMILLNKSPVGSRGHEFALPTACVRDSVKHLFLFSPCMSPSDGIICRLQLLEFVDSRLIHFILKRHCRAKGRATSCSSKLLQVC